MVIKRISPVSAAKISGVLYAGLGLLIGICFSVFSMLLGSMASSNSELSGTPFFGMIFGAGAIIIMPIFYGVIGAIRGLITALLYNLVAGMIGGLEIDVQ